MTEQHLGLLIDFKDGKPRREPIHVRPLGSSRFLLLQTPGFVYGVAGKCRRVRVGALGFHPLASSGSNTSHLIWE